MSWPIDFEWRLGLPFVLYEFGYIRIFADAIIIKQAADTYTRVGIRDPSIPLSSSFTSPIPIPIRVNRFGTTVT